MKELRRVFIEQKKKDIRNHFALVGVAVGLLSALAAALECLDLWDEENFPESGKKS